MARHKLSREQTIKGLRKALASPRLPPQFRPSMEKRLAKLMGGESDLEMARRRAMVRNKKKKRKGRNPPTRNQTCNHPVGRGHRCTRKKGHRGPHLPKGATLRPKSRLPRKWHPRKKRNAGEGQYFRFHGAFGDKASAVAKERSTPGAFIRKRYFVGQQGARYIVMTPYRGNPPGKSPRYSFRVRRIGTQQGIFKALQREAQQEKKAAAKLKPEQARLFNPKRKRRNVPRGTKKRKASKKTRKPLRRKNIWVKAKDGTTGKVLKMVDPQHWILLVPGQGRVTVRGDVTAAYPVKGNPKRKRNQNGAAKLFRDFHGKGPTNVMTVRDWADHPELAELGKLVLLQVRNKRGAHAIMWDKNEKPVSVAAEPTGRQIFFIGGAQNLDSELARLGVDKSKDLIDLGECTRIEYHAKKKFDDFRPVVYYHSLGEETGVRPRLVYDRPNRHMFLAGGEYKVEAPGIIN